MSHAVEHESGFERGAFIQSCDYCGARFEVFLARRSGADQDEDYACPECSKSYSVRAALPPRIELLTRRRDGKNDSYQETMF